MITIQGHRGARGHYPENTWCAFQYAIAEGADFLELDLAISRDGVPMITHDFFLNPMLMRWRDGASIGREVPVHAFTQAELRNLDCGSVANPAFPLQQTHPGSFMLSLAELFENVLKMDSHAANTVHFNLEIKSVPAGVGILHPKQREFVRAVLRVVKKYRLLKRVLIQSFDHSILLEARRLEPKVRISALFADNWLDYLTICKRLRADFAAPHQHWITRADVKKLQAAKIRVAAWTANEVRDWERLWLLGVDSIITDFPTELRAFLLAKSAGARKATQRRKQ